MRLNWRSLPTRTRRVVSVTLPVVIVGTYALVSASSQSVPATDTLLNDGSVWITKSAQLLIGELNRPVNQMYAYVSTGVDQPNVLQDGDTVFAWEQAPGILRPVDPATVALGAQVSVPKGASVVLGGGTVGIYSPSRHGGEVWAVPAADLTGFDPSEKPTIESVGTQAASNGTDVPIAAGTDGVLHVLSSSGVLSNISLSAVGVAATGTSSDVVPAGDVAQVSAVGGEAVVLDVTRDEVVVPGGAKVAVPGADPVIQQPGPAAPNVVVASSTGLYLVPLSGGSAEAVPGVSGLAGAPIAPVFLDGCANGAWARSRTYVYYCPGSATGPTEAKIPSLSTDASLVFRQNRDIVVLNDSLGGQTWIYDNGAHQVADWGNVKQALTIPSRKTVGKGKPGQAGSLRHTPPRAEPVNVGARPGQTVDWDIVAHDSDPDGAVLTLQPQTLQPDQGRLTVVDRGQDFQFTAPAGAVGSFSFPYSVTDGQGDVAHSVVNVHIYQPGENSPPTPPAPLTVTVQDGKSIRLDALSGWSDPQGDPFTLTAASDPADTPPSISPDGNLSLTATGPPGKRKIALTVTDDFGAPAHSAIYLDVRPAGDNLPPVTVADYEIVIVGEAAVLHPLAGDSDPNDYPLRLDTVAGGDGASVAPDYANGTIGFTASQAGTYYLDYTASDVPVTGAPATSVSTRIRVDAVDPSATSQPVAGLVTAYLPPAGTVDANVLAADGDPNGDVLVVQSVTVPAGAPLRAAVYESDDVQITDTAPLKAPLDLSYTVSDGTASATGTIEVVPAAPTSTDQPPITEPTTAVVQAGDVGLIDPLANDADPAGGALSIDPSSVKVDAAGGGVGGFAFADGNLIRYQAPPTPGQAEILYAARGSTGTQETPSVIDVTVVAADAANDVPPEPQPLTARVLAGNNVTIPVPLAQADPDGESVVLVGPTSSPEYGRIVAQTPSSFTYEAFPTSAGTDTFDYALRNRSGQIGEATVRVGVAARDPIDLPPVAPPFSVTVRPGRVVDVPVITNDFDPDGNPLNLLAGGLSARGVPVSAAGDVVQVGAMRNGATTTIRYQVTDGHSQPTPGVFFVHADSKFSAPPVAEDDYVNFLTNPRALTVDVPVLANDSDPDGVHADLRVVSLAPEDRGLARIIDNQQKVRVRLGRAAQVLTYTVRGNDGTASAAIFVPAQGTDGPQLRPHLQLPLQVTEGQSLRIDIDSLVYDPGGKAVRLTDSDSVSAAPQGALHHGHGTTEIVFVPPSHYFGPASLTFQVTNGKAADLGTRATFTVPITVRPVGETPPQYFGPVLSATVGTSSSYDLDTYAVDLSDPSVVPVLVFSGLSAPSYLHASVSGQTLTVDPGQMSSTPIVVSFSMTDGHFAPPVTGSAEIIVTAAASSVAPPPPGAKSPGSPAKPKPLATLIPYSTTVDQGSTNFLRVLTSASDPVPPLEIVGSSVVITAGKGRATASGTGITYQAPPIASGFSGPVTIVYSVLDGTKLKSREVQGQATVTVLGAPSAPPAPGLQSIGDGEVSLTFSAPADNGSPITAYELRWTGGGGGQKDCKLLTPCPVTGLANGTRYRFEVAALNAVRLGPYSQPSAPAVPNTLPGAPPAPTATFGDTSATLNWTAPPDQGSRVLDYVVVLSPGGKKSLPQTQRHYVWPGLLNGHSYTFQVEAENLAGFGPLSPSSAEVVPAGVPVAPQAPTATYVTNDPTGDELQVDWPATGDNGAQVSKYNLTILADGAFLRTDPVVPAPTATTIEDTVDHLTNGTTYSFYVTATNKAGTSAKSPTSTALTAFGAPGAPTNLSAAGNQNGQTTLSFTAPAANGGQAVTGYEYFENGSATGQALPANDVVGGLTNGTQYSFTVEACNTYCGPASNAATATPDIAPSAPTPGGSVSGTTFNFSWGAASSSGCGFNGGSSAMSWAITGGSGSPSSGGTSPSGGGISIAGSYNETITVTITVTDRCGLTAQASGSLTSGGPPQTVTIGKGPSASAYCSGCYWIAVNASGFPANTPENYECYDNGAEFWGPTVHPGGTYSEPSTDGNGNLSLPIGSGTVKNGCFNGNSRDSLYVTVGGVQSNTITGI